MRLVEDRGCSSQTCIERIKANLAPCPHGAKTDDSRRHLSIIDRSSRHLRTIERDDSDARIDARNFAVAGRVCPDRDI